MRPAQFVLSACLFASLLGVSGCGMLRSIIDPPPRPEPPVTTGTANRSAQGEALPKPRSDRQACTAEGETCRAEGAVCCPGLICTGSASGICISRH